MRFNWTCENKYYKANWLSILFMRFFFLKFYDYVQGKTVELSILFMRFLDYIHDILKFLSTFNSLYEIPLFILTKKWTWKNFSFNSLYEILTSKLSDLKIKNKPFNSLYEIQFRTYYKHVGNNKLSILFMRF